MICLLVGCQGEAATAVATPTMAATTVETALLNAATTSPPTIFDVSRPLATETPAPNRRVEQEPVYVAPLIPFDGIAPIYDPEFAAASEAPLVDDELVIGIAWGGEAKAYPITVLRFREMVNDELAGIPTLVTW